MALQPTQDQLGGSDPTDLTGIAAALSDLGVISGCNVISASPPSLTLTVVAGTVLVGGTQVTVAGTTVTLSGGQDRDRYDLVVVDSTGTPTVVQGSAANPPQEPSSPSAAVVLASVRVPAGAPTITPDLCADKRVLIGAKTKPTVTGSKLANPALTSLMAALVTLNLVIDTTS